MREIKFRAWDNVNNCWVMDCNYLWDWLYGKRGILTFAKGKRYTYMQFTGLYDRNGREIYEGDIVKNKVLNMTGIVNFTPDGTEIDCSGYFPPIGSHFIQKDFEVIGNIYENPEEGGGE